MKQNRKTFHAYLETLERTDYIVRVMYRELFDSEWCYQNLIYYYNPDEGQTYEIFNDCYSDDIEFYVIGFIPLENIDLSLMCSVPLNLSKEREVEE